MVDVNIGTIQHTVKQFSPVTRSGFKNHFADLMGFESLKRREVGDRFDFGFHAMSDGGVIGR